MFKGVNLVWHTAEMMTLACGCTLAMTTNLGADCSEAVRKRTGPLIGETPGNVINPAVDDEGIKTTSSGNH